jgi:hypothetical protein
MMNSPFDVVADYTVDDMYSNSGQRFVLFRCGMLLMINIIPGSEQTIWFGEVECTPDEFLDSVKEEEQKVRASSEGSDELDWGGWWEDIKFQYAVHKCDGSMIAPEWLMNNILKGK